MEMAEDEAEVETLLKQIALAKHKELRLRAEKKRIRDEMGQLQAGALWSREEQTQKQLVEVRRAKEQLEAQKRAEEEKLAKLSDNLREQELKFRRGFQSTPSSFQQAAASLVSTTSTPLQSAVGGSNQHENATPLQKDNAAVSLSMDTRLPRANMPSPLPPPSPRARSPDPVVANKGMNLQENDALQRLIRAEDNATMTPVNETAADDKEDSALRSLKRQHLESLAKVRNERDLLEEQEKLKELKEQIQRRRDEKKRELDHEEWVAKQKRELVALRLQRAIQHSVAKPADLQEESAEPYTPDSGFALFWDYAAGLPATVNDVQVTYAVFEGKVIRTPFKVVSSKETKAVGPQHKLCSFLFFRHIKKLPASTDLRVAMEVTVAAHHADRTQVVAENGSAFASMASDAFDPTFDAYVEYRQSNFNPTLTMVIRVDTLELVSKRPVILGYSVFPVFLDVETRDQPTRPSVPQFILNEGGFQLPLHLQVQSAEANQPLSAKSCDEFPRIPCATLLLRIVKAKLSGDGLAVLSRKDSPSHEWEAKGLLVPAPHYGDQFYDSLRCVPSGIEEKIYSIRHKNRRPKIVSQCLQQLSLSTSEARDTLKVKPAAYLDLTSALRYEPAIGFRIAVDALHNVKAKGGPFFKVLFSVYPPGSLYQTIRLTGDVYFTTTMDWTSAQTSPEFGDGYMTLRDSPTDQLLAVLFVVRSVTRHPKTGAFTSQQYGWTFLPVLAHSRFVNARTAQLPLFQGEVNLSVLKAAVGGLSSLVDDIGNEKVKQLVPVAEDGASLFVRIQDPQLPHLSSQPIVNASLSKMAPSRLSAKYTYDSAKIAALKKKTPVSKLLPTNTPENQFEKEMNQAFAQEMGIHHLLF
ncbi:hypothetical protein PF003_g33651 [Phytophthora fragariae]|nr:hypothetical protein PF003_g33651 [Phytophthora fragariae]